MSINKRKIGFYALRFVDKKDSEKIYESSVIKPVLSFIELMDPIQRIYDIPPANKFHLLHALSEKDGIQRLIFKSAKYFHRPPLINRENAKERENPKLLDEGESELTHVAFKYHDREVIVLIEERRAGMTINILKKYLYNFSKPFYKARGNTPNFFIEHTVIPKGDFLTELSKLDRIYLGNIYTNRNLLGSEHLGFSDYVQEVKEDIIITIKAKRGRSLYQNIKELYHKLMSSEININKMRVYGYTDEGNSILLDTDLVKRIEYVKVEVDEETGVVNSEEIFEHFQRILQVM